MNDTARDGLRARLEARLEDLRNERLAGQRLAAELDMRRAEVRDSLLRIDGAIQVLEEQLAEREETP